MRNKIVVTKRLADNSKVTDHHAIIPTEQYVNLNALNHEERNIFDLVAKRFIAVLSPSFEYEQTTIRADVQGEALYAKGKIVKSKGWKSIYDGSIVYDDNEEDEDKDQSLPDIKKNESLKILSVKTINGKTKPPARYTEETLLYAMENPGKFVANKTLKEALENSTGLGTPATRADIIEKLFSSFYIEKRGKDIFPTSKGVQLIGLVPQDLKSPELTAKWELQLSHISKGKANPDGFIKEMKSYATKLVRDCIASSAAYTHDNMTRERCPECGKYLLDVKGKKGKMLICSDRECGYRKSVSQISNARCPECHKKMEIRGEDEKK